MRILIIAVLFIGCSVPKHVRKQNRANRKIHSIKAEFPELFLVSTDTILIPYVDTIRIEGKSYRDTLKTSSDTIKVVNEGITTTVYIDRTEIVPEYIIKTEVKEDTLYLERWKTKYIVKEQTTEPKSNSKLLIGLTVLVLFSLILSKYLK